MKYFDLHCDTIATCTWKDIPLRENELHINLKKSAAMDTHVQCYAVFVPDQFRGDEAFQWFLKASDRLQAEIEKNSDVLAACKKPGDLDAAIAAGKHGAVLTIESAAAIGGKLENIEELKRRGVRMCTLTWNGENELGRGVMAEGTMGLSDFGKEAVRRFEEAGIIVDISHASPEMFWDVAEIATKPLIASHSNAKPVCGHVRNLTDEQFEAIKKSGGVIGLNYYTAFLNDDEEKCTMSDILRHAEHFLSMGGEKVVAMGSDFDGCSLPKDMQNGLGDIPALYELFLKHYSQELTDDIFFGNAARVFQGCGMM